MTRLIVNTIQTQSEDTLDFKDVISANRANQWVDTFGVIKANKTTIDENVTVPAGTNGLSAGTITVSDGYTVTIQGTWRII